MADKPLKKFTKLELAGTAISELARVAGFTDASSPRSSTAQGVDTYRANKPGGGAAASAGREIKGRRKKVDEQSGF